MGKLNNRSSGWRKRRIFRTPKKGKENKKMIDGGNELARARVLALLDEAELFDDLTIPALHESKMHAEHEKDFSPRQWDIVTNLIDARVDYLMEFAFIVYRTAFRDALEIVGCK